MMIYECSAESGPEIEIEAETAEEAAREYVDTGDWSHIEETIWIDVRVTDETGDSEEVTVTLDPLEPECSEDEDEHDWRRPHSVVGGCKSNPGVYGSGGGVRITSVCAHCGQYHIVDTWAQRPDTGEQGLTSNSYADADFASLAWVERRKVAR